MLILTVLITALIAATGEPNEGLKDTLARFPLPIRPREKQGRNKIPINHHSDRQWVRSILDLPLQLWDPAEDQFPINDMKSDPQVFRMDQWDLQNNWVEIHDMSRDDLTTDLGEDLESLFTYQVSELTPPEENSSDSASSSNTKFLELPENWEHNRGRTNEQEVESWLEKLKITYLTEEQQTDRNSGEPHWDYATPDFLLKQPLIVKSTNGQAWDWNQTQEINWIEVKAKYWGPRSDRTGQEKNKDHKQQFEKYLECHGSGLVLYMPYDKKLANQWGLPLFRYRCGVMSYGYYEVRKKARLTQGEDGAKLYVASYNTDDDEWAHTERKL